VEIRVGGRVAARASHWRLAPDENDDEIGFVTIDGRIDSDEHWLLEATDSNVDVRIRFANRWIWWRSGTATKVTDSTFRVKGQPAER